jgi:hypothetical protein
MLAIDTEVASASFCQKTGRVAGVINPIVHFKGRNI